MLARIIAPGVLRQAWQRVHANQGGAGGDGVTIDVFARDLEQQLGRLARDIATGCYRPGPLRRVTSRNAAVASACWQSRACGTALRRVPR